MAIESSYSRQTQNWMALAPDLTPMIDVMFILMIFFILTANSAKEIMHITLPSTQEQLAQAGQEKDQLMVTLTDTGSFYLEHTEYATLEGLKEALAEVDKSKSLLVASDKEAKVDQFVQLLSALRAADFTIANILMESQ